MVGLHLHLFHLLPSLLLIFSSQVLFELDELTLDLLLSILWYLLNHTETVFCFVDTYYLWALLSSCGQGSLSLWRAGWSLGASTWSSLCACWVSTDIDALVLTSFISHSGFLEWHMLLFCPYLMWQRALWIYASIESRVLHAQIICMWIIPTLDCLLII